MLALSCLPCSDSEECNEKEQQEISVSSAQQGQEHEAESCTPFFICNCCASVSFIQLNNQLKNISSADEKIKFFCLPDNFDSYDSRYVWQPPRARAFA